MTTKDTHRALLNETNALKHMSPLVLPPTEFMAGQGRLCESGSKAESWRLETLPQEDPRNEAVPAPWWELRGPGG